MLLRCKFVIAIIPAIFGVLHKIGFVLKKKLTFCNSGLRLSFQLCNLLNNLGGKVFMNEDTVCRTALTTTRQPNILGGLGSASHS